MDDTAVAFAYMLMMFAYGVILGCLIAIYIESRRSTDFSQRLAEALGYRLALDMETVNKYRFKEPAKADVDVEEDITDREEYA